MVVAHLALGRFDHDRAAGHEIKRAVLIIVFAHPDAQVFGPQPGFSCIRLGESDLANGPRADSERLALHAHFRMGLQERDQLHDRAADAGVLRSRAGFRGPGGETAGEAAVVGFEHTVNLQVVSLRRFDCGF
jgi:hypothetical protein